MKKVFVSFLFALIFILNTKSALADYGQYQEPSKPQIILIDKFVGKPTTNKGGYTDVEYVDNLSSSDPRFHAGQTVFFKIKVKNTSSVKIYNVTVRDYVPSYLDPIEGPGSWDSSNRTITWSAGDFEVDEEKTYYLKMQVYSSANLPADKGLFCMVNKAEAKNDNTADDDSSQYCVEKEVTGVTTTPSAGPEMALAIVALNGLGLITGLKLRKKS
jgi:uncharacterized repeat protein (TIGR01451 family)